MNEYFLKRIKQTQFSEVVAINIKNLLKPTKKSF